MIYNGTVSKITPFNYQNKTLWSFQMQGIKSYFRTGEKHPGVEPGNAITFEGNPNAKGDVQVDVGSIKRSAEQQSSGVQGAVQRTFQGGNRDFPTRDEREATQRRIEIQSCRNSALELVKILLDKGELKFGPKVDKVKAIEEMVSHYTEKFLDENSSGPSVGSGDNVSAVAGAE